MLQVAQGDVWIDVGRPMRREITGTEGGQDERDWDHELHPRIDDAHAYYRTATGLLRAVSTNPSSSR